MQKITGLITATLLATLVLGFVSTTCVGAVAVFEPNSASAVVDGNSGEWNIGEDFFADMYVAWNDDKPVLSKIYLRYDISSSTMYILVLAEPGVTIEPSSGSSAETWVKIDDGIVVSDLYSSSVFQYIYNSATPVGWEASFLLQPGQYTIEVHNLAWDNGTPSELQTSGTIKNGLQIFVVPEYFLGGIVAIGACFAAFIAVKKLPAAKPRI